MEKTVEDGTELLELRYFLKDHIGSLLAIAEGGSQVLLQEFHYDVWGKREFSKSNDNPYVGAPEWDSFGLSGRQGFTGHEMLDNVGLIHMNGRVYDPELGRFVSADPIIQAPNNSQSFNRYSYVWNNPLSYTDPSGFEPREPEEEGYRDWKDSRDNGRERDDKGSSASSDGDVASNQNDLDPSNNHNIKQELNGTVYHFTGITLDQACKGYTKCEADVKAGLMEMQERVFGKVGLLAWKPTINILAIGIVHGLVLIPAALSLYKKDVKE